MATLVTRDGKTHELADVQSTESGTDRCYADGKREDGADATPVLPPTTGTRIEPVAAPEPIPAAQHGAHMKVVKSETSGTWHLVGSRGCGSEPDGERIEGNWAVIRDRVERDGGTRCSHCRWPSG